MNILSRTITGIVMIIVGLFLIGLCFFIEDEAFWVPLIYGIPILIIGFFILFNTREDHIEQIKKKRKYKGGKKK